ncbi:GntR family transcriptional regulator [Planobispora siamensis]|uniref:GntR family transcriptional regulator n=1 Tax=Planobispora siamensis TaxID=936338 RepID=A0A8J3SL09_9ACTN|nr:GntR family transcriptional regulator [Planobispora siamensis]GIH91558.1 GntR family transcriptional regulator [Planobispora siamensis]
MATEPLYQQVADDLRTKILAGEYPAGTFLPSEPTLEEDYSHLDPEGRKVSRNTIRQALASLQNEGLIDKRQGRGSFVREQRTFIVLASREEGVRPGEGTDAFVAAVRVAGRQAEQRNLQTAIRVASPEVAAGLKLEPGAAVVVRSVQRMLDGRPWSLQESFYPMEIAQGTKLISPENVEHGTIEELRRHGHAQIAYRDEVECRMPTREEADFLGSEAPVLVLNRVARSAERPIRLTVTVYDGASTRLAYEVDDLP